MTVHGSIQKTTETMNFTPSPEQERARAFFQNGKNLRIDAYAGTGKTTTLKLLTQDCSRRGLYMAFNRVIAEDAKRSFPSSVSCATAHSLAFRAIVRTLGYPDWKLTGALTPNTILEQFRMPPVLEFRSGVTLTKWAYGSILLHTIRRFLQSEEETVRSLHIPRFGLLEMLPDTVFEQFGEQAIEHAGAIWNAMCHKSAGLPLGHDGYLKLWALSRPRASVDYILIDEAQDLNPVLLGVLRNLTCQIVYVGDPYQQIYEWRGAVNAMDQVEIQDRVLLSQSYRFGPVIAEAATSILRTLGAQEPVRGVASLESNIAAVIPQIILSRTNSGVIGNVLRSLAAGRRCHVLGGTKALSLLLTDVQRVKAGQTGASPELLGFNSWKDVMSFSAQTEGEHLGALVNLVQEYGEGTMLRALAGCEESESDAQVVCSTAHKSKGREWGYVGIDTDFLEPRPQPDQSKRQQEEAAELRLLYVAITRARFAVDLPASILSRFDLKRTTSAVLNALDTPSPENASSPHDPRLEGVISPYHSAKRGEAKEMAFLRKILG